MNTGKTLVQWTYERYAKFIPAENIFIVTSEEYVEIVKQQLPLLPVENIYTIDSPGVTPTTLTYIDIQPVLAREHRLLRFLLQGLIF